MTPAARLFREIVDETTAPAAPPKTPRPRWRRVLRAFALGLLMLVLFVALAPFVAWKWLTSASGGRWLRAEVLQAASDQIEGRIEIDRVSLSGLVRLELEGVRLYAPGDAQPAASIDRVVVDVRATALAAKRLELSELALEKPVVHVVPENGTTNLARAVKPKKPAAPEKEKPSSGPSTFVVKAPDVRIENGALRVDGPSPVAVDDVDLQLAVNGTLEKLSVASKLSVHALQPIERSAVMSLEARYLGDKVEIGALSLASGASHVGLSGEAAVNGSAGKIEISDAHLAAEDVNELAPAAHLLGDVGLVGKAAFDRTSAKANLVATLPSGAVELNADAHLAPPDAEGFLLGYTADLHVRGVEVDKVVAGVPKARLVADLSVKGSGLPPHGTAEISLDASKSRYENLPLHDARITLKSKGLRADITSLHLAAAGVTVAGSGPADAKAAQLNLDIAVPDLAHTREALASGLHLELPEMTGSVHLAGRTGGTYRAPQGTFTLDVPDAAIPGNAVHGLVATLSLDRLSPPAGSLTNARIGSFEAAGVQGRQIKLGAKLDGESLKVDLDGELAGPPHEPEPGTPPAAPQFLPVALSVDAVREPAPERGVERWKLRRFAASALGLHVASEQEAVVESGRGETKVDGLVLGGDFGRVALSGTSRTNGSFDAALTIDRLQVEQLPASLMPPSLGLKGTFEGSASAHGTSENPVVSARLRLVEGGYRALAPIAGEVEVALENRIATARGSFSLPEGGRAGFQAKLPASAPNAPVPAGRAPPPIDAAVFLDNVNLALVQRVATDVPQVWGALSGAMQLSGTWAAPVLDGTLQVDRAAGFGVDSLTLALGYGWKDGHATATATAKRPGTLDARVEAAFPLSAPEVLAGKTPDFRKLPLDVRLALGQLDLGWLAAAKLAPEDLAGKVAGKLRLVGSTRAPQADGTIEATGLHVGGYSDLAVLLDLDGRDRVQANAHATLGGQDFAAATLTLGVEPGKLADLAPADWLDVPLQFEARLLPTSVHRLVPAGAPGPGEAPPPYDANVAARFTFEGTAANPEAHFHAVIDQLLLKEQKIGSASFDLDSVGPGTTMHGAFVSREAGSFQLDGQLAGSLSAKELAEIGRRRLVAADPSAKPSLGQALAASVEDVKQRRLDLVASSTNFDLAVVNGLVPGVRDIAGRLDLHLEKHGPAAAPDVSGKVLLAGGKASVVEFGAFDQVRMDVDLAWPKVALNELSGHAGSGTFVLKARGDAAAGGGYAGEAHARVDALPLVQNYQTRGYLTLKADAGEITWRDGTLNVPKLVLSDGLLKIPERPQKVVQSLDPHPDIVFAGAAQQKAAEKPGWKANVGIVVPDDFKVDAPLGNSLVLGANLTARLDEALNRDGKGPFDLSGKIRLPRGKISILQARFDVQPQSVVTLFPRQWDNPTLDITATYEKVASGTPVSVTATFTGTVSNMVRNFSSKPPMDEAEIVYFIATGQRQQRAQSDPFALNKETLDDTLVGLIGSIGSSFAKSFLQKYIGGAADLDVLSLDTRGNAKVGTYLWNGKLYLGAQVRPNANVLAGENTAELNAEYRINEKTFGRLRVGDQSRSGLEILYQDNVPADSQKRSDGR